MNRSILIVICDFLLVSLLVFSSPDVSRISGEGPDQSVKLEMQTNQASSGSDLTAAMKQALDEEKKTHDELLGELTRTRQVAGKQDALLTEREKLVETYQKQLQSREQEAARMQDQQSALLSQYTAAQTNLAALNARLASSTTESALSNEKLAALQAELQKKADEAAALQRQLTQLGVSNQTILSDRQRLASQLQVAEAERQSAAAQAARMEQEIKTERDEKAKLAEGVQALASKSGELAKEVHNNTPLAPNTIFNDLITNRIQASFTVSRPGLFGESSKHKDTQTVLVTDGINTYAVCHVEDTPLTFYNPGIDWKGLAGSLSGARTILPIRSMSFNQQDPRIVMVPVSPAEASQLGCKIYRTANDPYKFEDAVLIGARDGYYGECRFEIDLTTPQYVKLDRSFLKGLFGKFNPSSGDLVLSRTGEVLGIMVNGTYCLMLHDMTSTASLQFGNDVSAEHTGQTLTRLYSVVSDLPFKLQ